MGKSIYFNMVGAKSPNLPDCIAPLKSLEIIKKGTGLSVWAVLGDPSSLIR